MVPDSHEQWYGTVLHEQESCVPHHGHFASLGEVGGLDSSENCPLDLV